MCLRSGVGLSEKRDWEHRQGAIRRALDLRLQKQGCILKAAGTRVSDQVCMVKWRTAVTYIFLWSTRSANELALCRLYVDLEMIWEAGLEWVMRYPGGSPKTTSWHRHWWDSEGRERNWTLGGLQRGSAEGRCELDSGSGPGHGEQRVLTHLEAGRAAVSSLVASLAFMLWCRNLTTETLIHPRAALWTWGSAPVKDGELRCWAPRDHRLQEENRRVR